MGLTAFPNVGYEVVKRSDGKTENKRLAANVSDNVCLPSEFKTRVCKVEYIAQIGGNIKGASVQHVKYGENGTTVTAISDEAYDFYCWSDGVQTATRTDTYIEADKIVTAIFKKKTFIVRYESFNTTLGSLQDIDAECNSDIFTYKVEYGEAAPPISAFPNRNFLDEEYAFLYWSDGVTTLERHDTNITSDNLYTAYFGYRIDYKVNGNIGGRIEGNVTQKVLSGKKGEVVRAVADKGYEFVGWSNLSCKSTTQDDPNHEWGDRCCRSLEIIAYFEPVKKTFFYDYGFTDGMPSCEQITLDRNSLDNAEFVVPSRDGYSFCGWYADKDYLIRITTETGRYIYGFAAFSLETDTLYAKWQKDGEHANTHKILMIFVDEVQTTLYSSRLRRDVAIESKMTALDYDICKWSALKVYNLLNEWFEGKIKFEVDSYYTTKPIFNGFDRGKRSNGWYDYDLFAESVDEVFDIKNLYHNTVTYVCCHDYEGNLFRSSGAANCKNACVIRDNEWYLAKLNNIRIQDFVDLYKNGDIDLNLTIVETCLHELIHTAEMYYDYDDARHNCLHEAINYAIGRYGKSSIVNTLKPCLLGKFEMNGVLCGIPVEYWKHEIDIPVNYVSGTVRMRNAGKIRVVGEALDIPVWECSWIARNVPYGSDFSVEAVPDDGYRFLRWSDGVSTAIRRDKKIIAYLNVKAIFEKV